MAGGVEIVGDEAVGAGMQRQIPGLAALAGHLQMRHALARVAEVFDLELAQLLTPQRVEQQRGQNGAVALALDRVVRRCVQQLARLMVAERRRLAFAAFRLRPLDAFHRVMADGVLLTQIFEQRGERRQPVPDRAAAKPAPHQVVAPGDDVGPRHRAKLPRPGDASEAHEVADRVLVDAARVGIAEIGEPLDLGRHIGELMELGGGQQSVAGRDPGRQLLGAVGRPGDAPPCFHAGILFLIKSVINGKVLAGAVDLCWYQPKHPHLTRRHAFAKADLPLERRRYPP